MALLNTYLPTFHKILAKDLQVFFQPHLDYTDIIYDNPVNESLINKPKKLQYQARLAITVAIQGTSCESLYNEIGLESLQSRHRYTKLIFFYRILNSLTTKYLFDTIPVLNDSCYNTRAKSKSELTQFHTRTKICSNTFFSFCIKE